MPSSLLDDAHLSGVESGVALTGTPHLNPPAPAKIPGRSPSKMLTLKNENHPSIFLHPGAYGSLAIWDAGRDALLVFGFSGRETKSALPILQAYLELHHSVRLPKDAKPSSPADLCELQKVQAHPSTD